MLFQHQYNVLTLYNEVVSTLKRRQVDTGLYNGFADYILLRNASHSREITTEAQKGKFQKFLHFLAKQ